MKWGGSYSRENAMLESKLFKVETIERVAKRKLKHPCGICGKPILKGQKYVRKKKFIGFGYVVQWAHVECLD